MNDIYRLLYFALLLFFFFLSRLSFIFPASSTVDDDPSLGGEVDDADEDFSFLLRSTAGELVDEDSFISSSTVFPFVPSFSPSAAVSNLVCFPFSPFPPIAFFTNLPAAA